MRPVKRAQPFCKNVMVWKRNEENLVPVKANQAGAGQVIRCYSEHEWELLLKRDVLEEAVRGRLKISLQRGIPETLRARVWRFLTSSARSRR